MSGLGRWGAHASFSNVTVADCGASCSPELGVIDREVIFPLDYKLLVAAFIQ